MTAGDIRQVWCVEQVQDEGLPQMGGWGGGESSSCCKGTGRWQMVQIEKEPRGALRRWTSEMETKKVPKCRTPRLVGPVALENEDI